MPKTRVQFWRDKFEHNLARDRKNETALIQAGWRVLTIWECETRNPHTLATKLREEFVISGGEATANVRLSSLHAT